MIGVGLAMVTVVGGGAVALLAKRLVELNREVDRLRGDLQFMATLYVERQS